MSYRCEFCNRVSDPGEQLRLVTTKVRVKPPGHPGGDYGVEIAEEKRQCTKCWTDAVGVES